MIVHMGIEGDTKDRVTERNALWLYYGSLRRF